MASKFSDSTQEDTMAKKSKGFPFRYNDELETLFFEIVKRIRSNADLHLLLEKPISQEPPNAENNAQVVGITSNLFKLDLENKRSKLDRNIEAEIEKTISSIGVSTRKAEKIIRSVIKDLEIELKTHNFTEIEWTCYGSYMNGLCTTHSDTIDLSCEYGENTQSAVKNLVLKFNDFFETSSSFRVEECYEDARVPIIKLFHKGSEKKVNITFFNELAVRNLWITRLYLNLNSHLRSLTLYLKNLLMKYDLCGKNRITTHVLFWLVVYFMQEKGLLPSVKAIREAATEQCYVSGWNCSVPDEFSHPIEKQPGISSLFLEFFQFYNGFDFFKYVMSPYHGSSFPIEEFMRNLPIPEEAYNDESVKNANCFFIRCLNIQDPVTLNYNLTAALRINVVNSFKLLCYRFATDQSLLTKLPPKLTGYGNKPPNDFKRYVAFDVFLRHIPTSWWTDINRHVRDGVRKMMEMIFEFEPCSIVEQDITWVVRGKDGSTEQTSTVMYFDYCSTEKTWKNEHFLNILFGKLESKSSGEPVARARNVVKDDELGRVYLIIEINPDKQMVYVFLRSDDRMAKFLHKHFGRLLLFVFNKLRCN